MVAGADIQNLLVENAWIGTTFVHLVQCFQERRCNVRGEGCLVSDRDGSHRERLWEGGTSRRSGRAHREEVGEFGETL